MVIRLFNRREQELMDDDPLQFVLWLMAYNLRKHLYIIKPIILIVMSYLQIFNFICIKDIILNKNFTYLEYLPIISMQQSACCGWLIILIYERDFFQYHEILFSTFWSISSGGEKTKDRIIRESLIIKLVCVITYGLCFLVNLSLFPFVGDEKRFVFAVMYCTEHFGRWSKVFIFIFYFCMSLITHGIVCPLFAAIYVTFHAKFQFYLLNENIRKIPKEDLVRRNCLRSKLMHQNTIYESLSSYAKHNAVIRMVTSTFYRKTQNLTMLMYSGLGVLTFVSASCFIIFEVSPSSNWRMFIALSCMISIFLTFCVSGQRITDESNQFFVTLYNTPWYHWERRSQMALKMMLVHSLEPLKVSCFGLVDLNYAFILSALRTVYSLLAISRKFK